MLLNPVKRLTHIRRMVLFSDANYQTTKFSKIKFPDAR